MNSSKLACLFPKELTPDLTHFNPHNSVTQFWKRSRLILSENKAVEFTNLYGECHSTRNVFSKLLTMMFLRLIPKSIEGTSITSLSVA